jgi:hypothetical protein
VLRVRGSILQGAKLVLARVLLLLLAREVESTLTTILTIVGALVPKNNVRYLWSRWEFTSGVWV